MINSDDITIKESKKSEHFKCAFRLIKKSYWGKLIKKQKFDIQNQNTKSFFIFYKNDILGFFRLLTDGVFVVYIMDFIIDEQYRQSGIGSKTLQHIETLFPESKILLSSNKSETFYLKNNFKKIQKEDNFYVKRFKKNKI
ncbi:MAG: GNAT family N-acetyltransferase [Flavobacteriaceae bacterium]